MCDARQTCNLLYGLSFIPGGIAPSCCRLGLSRDRIPHTSKLVPSLCMNKYRVHAAEGIGELTGAWMNSHPRLSEKLGRGSTF